MAIVHNISKIKPLLLLVLACMVSVSAMADERLYKCEFGIQAGCGYYAGDATPHIFQNVREAYGADFRWRFTQRWAINVKGMAHRIVGPMPNQYGVADADLGKWKNQLVNLGVSAEYNFFRFGEKQYDIRVKPITPYIAVGVGMCLHDDFQRISAYMPFGVGMKWKFAERCNLNVLWEHNVYFADNLECGIEAYNNSHELNGSNLLNCDVTGTLTVGLSVEFGKLPRKCRHCELERNKNDW